MYEKHGEPKQFEVDLCDDEEPLGPEAPKLATRPAWLGKHPEQYSPSEAKLLITDFGEAYSPSAESQHGRGLHNPSCILPPEMRFGKDPKYSFQSDIWALGCTICEFFSEYPLFYCYISSDHVIAKQIDILGQPPQNWWEKWEARHQFFTEVGERLSSKWQHPSWKSHFEEDIQRSRREAWMPELDVEEKNALMELLQSMVRWEPEKLLTIQGVLDSKWMGKWALPEFERAFET